MADLALVEGMLQTLETPIILVLVLEEIRLEQAILAEVVVLALVIRIIQIQVIPVTLEVVDLASVEEIPAIPAILETLDLVLEEILLVHQTREEILGLASVEAILETPAILVLVLVVILTPVTLVILEVLDLVLAVIQTLAIPVIPVVLDLALVAIQILVTLVILVVLDLALVAIQTRAILVVLDLALEEIRLVRQTQEEREVLASAAILAPLAIVAFLLETNRIHRTQAFRLARVSEHRLEPGQAALVVVLLIPAILQIAECYRTQATTRCF